LPPGFHNASDLPAERRRLVKQGLKRVLVEQQQTPDLSFAPLPESLRNRVLNAIGALNP
jgi:hypothetical protein